MKPPTKQSLTNLKQKHFESNFLANFSNFRDMLATRSYRDPAMMDPWPPDIPELSHCSSWHPEEMMEVGSCSRAVMDNSALSLVQHGVTPFLVYSIRHCLHGTNCYMITWMDIHGKTKHSFIIYNTQKANVDTILQSSVVAEVISGITTVDAPRRSSYLQ